MKRIYKVYERSLGTAIFKRVENSEYWGDFVQVVPSFEVDDFETFGIFYSDGMYRRSEFSETEAEMLREVDGILERIKEAGAEK